EDVGVVEKWRNSALELSTTFLAYLAHLTLLAAALLWGWNGGGTAGSGGVMMQELH
ncbi:uncharacterized, partial [Tachysurus ichikawai]